MVFRQRAACQESVHPALSGSDVCPFSPSNPPTLLEHDSLSVRGRGVFALLSSVFLVLGFLAGSASAAGSTANIDMKIFSPDSVLNGYWMYMDSTITTSNGTFGTADEGNVGAGDWVKIANGGHFKTPTLIGGDLWAAEAQEKLFDSSLWVLKNASFGKTIFTSALSKVQIDGNMSFSSNTGTDSAETWVGGNDTVLQNSVYVNKLHVKDTLYAHEGVFNDLVYFDNAKADATTLLRVGGQGVSTTAYTPPFSSPVFFDSTKIPAYGLAFTLPTVREHITATYATDVTGCTNYPGVSYVNLAGVAKTIPAGKVLPPGYYGNVDLYAGQVLVLGEGFYYFDQVDLWNSGAKIVTYQPTGERTIIYANNGFSTHSGGIFVGADSGYIASKFGISDSAEDFSGGTVMIAAGPHAKIYFDSDADIWATLSTPTGTIEANSQIKLYGQMFGRHFRAANQFNGGEGKFIPFFPDPPVISFDVKVFKATVGEPDLLTDGVTPDTVVARFPLKMDHINGSAVTVWYHTVDVTAQAGGTTALGTRDYVQVAKGSVSIKPTFDTASILIKVLGDAVYDEYTNETFRVVLDSVTNGSLGPLSTDSSGVGTIVDNESELYMRLVPVVPTRLTRPVSSALDTAFHYRLQIVDRVSGKVVPTKVNASAKIKLVAVSNTTIGTDVTLPVGMFSFVPGDSSIDVRVVVPKADIFKPNAVFQLVLDSTFGAKKLDSIVNDTLVSPAVKLVIGNGTANQSTSTTLGLPVQLVRQSDGVAVRSSVALPYTWSTLDSTAKAGVHFTGVPSGTAGSFPAAVLTDSVRVSLIRNPLLDSVRHFKVALVPGTYTGLSAAKDTGVGTIVNGWPKPAISIDDTTVQRQAADFVLKVPVRLSRGATFPSTYGFAAVDGGAVNGVDFALVAGSSKIASTDTIRITIKASNQLDSTRHFVLTIPVWDTSKLATVAAGSDTAATITITSAISGARLLVDSASANQSTSTAIRFPVRLVDASGNPITSRIAVPYVFSTIDGSAKGGTNFVGASSSPDTLAAGGGVDTFAVALIHTDKYDSTRHFQVEVAPVSGTNGLSNLHDSATGTILNGYAVPAIHIDSASIVRPKVKTPLSFRVWLDRASAIDLPFSWATRDGSAIADTDYVAVATSASTIRDSVFVPVSILARPNEYDTTRHFHVDLSNLAAFTVGNSTAPGAIVPALGAPYLWVMPSSVFEGPAGVDTHMVFQVELRDSTGAAMTSRLATSFTWNTVADYAGNGRDSLAYSTAHGAFGADYSAVASGSGTVPVLSGTGTFSVVVHGNDIKQADRVLQTRISAATWGRVDATGSTNVGTILDDDSISARAYFPVAKDTIEETISIAWVPVLLTAKALYPDTLVVSVDSRSTAVRDTNYVLLQPDQADIRDTSKVPATVATTVRLVIQPGDSVFWVPVRIRHDSVRTADLKLILDLSLVNPYAVKVDPGRAQTELSIFNIDPPPYLGFRDTAISVVRGKSIQVRVAVRPLRSDKDPSAQYTGTLSDPTGNTTPSWTTFVQTSREGSTPTFTRMDLDTSFVFATLDDGRDGPDLRVVLRMHDWTADEALAPLAGDTVLHDSVVIWIRNGNTASKASFWTNSVTVKDADGQLAVKVLLNRSSNWSTATSVTRTGEAADVYFDADSSVRLSWKPGDTVATFVLKYGNDHKVGKDREFDLHLGDFLHLAPGTDSVLHVRIQNTNVGPEVKILTPKEGAKLGKKDLDSLGKVPVTWSVDGKTMTPYDTLLPEGRSTIVKCYEDQWGNGDCDSVHVTLDTTPPVVVITHVSKDGGKTWLVVSPTDTPWVNKTDVQVKWISIDDGDTSRHQDGETLKDSINKVLRCIEDAVGNKGCGSGLVGLDTIPPKVWIQTPPNGSHWSAGCIATIWYEADRADTIRHDTTLCFSTTGPHVISVSSKPDRAGNVGTATSTIVIDPNEPGTATYVDTDNDGRIDAVVVQFPRAWTDSLPEFDISYGGPGENTRPGVTSTYGDKSQAGVEKVIDGKTVRVLVGIAALGSDGKPLRDAEGDIVYQAPGGVPLLGSDGKQVVDENGVPLWKVTGTGRDSSVLVIKLDPALPYGWTSSTIDSLGTIHAQVTVVDSAGKAVKKDMALVFDVVDGVAPVILSATTDRTEDYDGRDILTIKVSEPVVFDSTGNWLEIKVGGQWVKVPAESLEISDDGMTIRIPLPPGEDGVPDPGVQIRFLGGVSDTAGNRVSTDDVDWSIKVTGDPRKPILDVSVVDPIGKVSSKGQSETRKSGFVITATNGGDREDYTPWRPGEGYLGNSGDQQFRDVCPEITDCNGLEIEVNHPMRVQVYVYDLMGIHAGGFSFELTQQDLDDMNPDKLDRYRIRVLWNQRGQDGRVVSSGIYPWRVIAWVQVDAKTPPVLTNTIVKLGVKTKLQ